MLFSLAKPFLHALDAEDAHRLTITGLKTGLYPCCGRADDARLAITLWNKTFKNPVGLAAGFDKNAEVIAPMLGMGFGYVEVGTVTPKLQEGNPRPRVFRAAKDEAVINRMGFPNQGVAVFKKNVETYRRKGSGLVGLNIGMNKDQTDPAADYTLLIGEVGALADYLTVNISSPNTPGLRNLQDPEYLKPLLAALINERNVLPNKPPLLVKLAPDLDEPQQQAIAACVMEAGIDGLILTNTTLARPDYLPEDFAAQKGGLSGKPLTEKSTDVIRNFYRLTNGALPIIGAGGISSAEDAYAKIKAGASLVQLYSSLVYHGPTMVKKINQGLTELLQQDGHASLQDAVGKEA